MLHANDERVRPLLLKGCFGLERETLRITGDGFLAQTPNPFEGHEHIVRDFSENQLEINTGVSDTPQGAVDELAHWDAEAQRVLAAQPKTEYLWPFSNPPYIGSWRDIPIAQFNGEDAFKTAYREYLSDRYGRYKMTFSGIHFNYSFSEELLRADFQLSDETDFVAYKDRFYMNLAQQAVVHGWLITAITAASPLMDSSFVEKGKLGEDLYMGLATPRCSELGYWNDFAPILDYSSAPAYAASIQRYVDKGYIMYPSELYYPVRVKPRGTYSLDNIAAGNLSHIELRMFDLNPLYPAGINVQDVLFGQLFLVWLASIPLHDLEDKDQVQAVQKFKNASHFDLKTVKVADPTGEVRSMAKAALALIELMEEFYADFGPEVLKCLAFQKSKFADKDNRYAAKVKELYSGSFVKKGLELARDLQRRALAQVEEG